MMSQDRSLGTMAMAKRFDSDSSDAESVRQPWCPPPPTAPVRVKRKEVAKPVLHLPPLPPVPLFHQIVRLTYFSEDLSRHTIIQVAKALQYLHEEAGVVHRFATLPLPCC
jgi:serine/threonine protein kinase